MENERSLREEIELMRKTISGEKEKKKEKKFKIPFRAKLNNQKLKKNWVTYLYVKDNGDVDFRKEQIVDQTTMLDGSPRIATSDTILRYKGKPLIIQPSWSVKPFSPVDNYNETEKQNLNSKGYRLLMIRMQQEAIKAKMKLNWLLILGGLVIAGIVIYALFFGK